MRPNRSHLVVKKKIVTRPKQPAVKPVSKIIQRSTKEEPKKPEQNKQEVKKQEPQVKSEVKSPPTPAKSSGDYELNALMTRMVAVELKQLMTKTFEDLLDNPADEMECYNFQRLRIQVVRDLKNILGLNITKRLLNIFNPLNVKIKFNGKPEKEHLREFLKKYNFIAFTRKAVNIFAAQIRNIDDFDRLCTEKEVKCGNVKVSVSPAYSFTTCPPNLKTKYKYVYLEDIENDFDKDVVMENVENKSICETSKNIKATVKQENNSPPKQQIKQENTEVQAAQVSNNVVKNNKANKPIPSDNKPAQNIPSKEIAKKPEPPKAIKTENNVVSPSKPVTKVTTPNKQTTVTATAKTTPAKTVAKVSPTKPATQVTPVKTVTKVAQTKGVAKTTQNKSATKVSLTKGKAKQSKSTDDVDDDYDEDDYDELDDHDILALMSEGIVLDECCGSDEE